MRRVSMLEERRKHDHAEWIFHDSRFLLHDPRRFGAILWHPASDGPVEEHPLLARLGLEPLDPSFNGAHLAKHFAGRRVAVKQALLAGNVVVGVGNIYASEALYLAGIDPRLPAGQLSRRRCDKLAEAVKQTLSAAIESGGSTLRDYVNATGEPGAYFHCTPLSMKKRGNPASDAKAPSDELFKAREPPTSAPLPAPMSFALQYPPILLGMKIRFYRMY